MATTMAPPTMAATSRVRPELGKAAAPVCRLPRPAPVVVASEPVGCTLMIVVEVRVLTSPLGKVVVALKTEVDELSSAVVVVVV